MRSIRIGITILMKSLIKNIPHTPGVYKMLNSRKEVLYVGKAKNLYKRLHQYLKPNNDRIQVMVMQIADISITTTNTEVEALILEASLIKDLQPKYNILLKDDKSYPHILITLNHQFPRLMKYRGKYHKGCYGPFPSVEKLESTISVLHRAFQLRSCSDKFFSSRKRPCLEYQIKRCSAPCVGKISLEEYSKAVRDVARVLEGRVDIVQQGLKAKMEEASAIFNYELALIFRDKLRALQYLDFRQTTMQDGDCVAIYHQGEFAYAQILSFSDYTLQRQHLYKVTNVVNNTEEEIFHALLMQFYHHDIPSTIVSNYHAAEETISALESVLKKRVNIHCPQKGKKLEILNSALKNLKQHLYTNNTEYFLGLIQCTFALKEIPQRIEVYDNSHVSGSDMVGAMIVVDKNGFNKSEYRCFSLVDNRADDYSAMQEVLSRRMKNDRNKPDFILIDGGKGHMSAVKDILIGVDFACISKGENRHAGNETFHTLTQGSFKLPRNSEIFSFLQRIRDEAHRFAVSTHRRKRVKGVRKSLLDGVPNIGKVRKKILLTHFGSVDNIKQATVTQLSKVSGISKTLAQLIATHLDNS